MNDRGRRFDPVELADEWSSPSMEAEITGAVEAARRLEAPRRFEAALGVQPAVVPSPRFGDRVMAAIAREPSPSQTGFLVPLRGRPGAGGLVESIRRAWQTVTEGSIRTGARAMALAYVLVVALAVSSVGGAAAYGTAGALGRLVAGPTTTSPSSPIVESAIPSGPLDEPSAEPGETERGTPTESPDGSESASDGGDTTTPGPASTPHEAESQDH